MFNFKNRNTIEEISAHRMLYTSSIFEIKPFLILLLIGTYMTIKSALTFYQHKSLNTFALFYLMGTAFQFLSLCFLSNSSSNIARSIFEPHKVIPSTLSFICIILVLMAGVIFLNPHWVLLLVSVQTLNVHISGITLLMENVRLQMS